MLDKGYIVYIVKLYFLNLILTSIIKHLSIIDDTSTSVMFTTSFGGNVTVEQKNNVNKGKSHILSKVN